MLMLCGKLIRTCTPSVDLCVCVCSCACMCVCVSICVCNQLNIFSVSVPPISTWSNDGHATTTSNPTKRASAQ